MTCMEEVFGKHNGRTPGNSSLCNLRDAGRPCLYADVSLDPLAGTPGRLKLGQGKIGSDGGGENEEDAVRNR